ncbi:MAG: hypothetical protein P8Y67_12485, partial [Alphaproteobacteria bacterium]
GSGGLSEISGKTALMVPAVTAEAIAAATERLITDVELRERLAREGMVQVREHFDIAVQAARMDAFYCAVASGEPAVATDVSQKLSVSAGSKV